MAGVPFGSHAVLLSDFTGADENPLSEGGNWAQTNTPDPHLRRVSNQVTCASTLTGSKYWVPSSPGPDCEIYMTIATKPGNGDVVGVFARVKDEGASGTWDGIQAIFSAAAGTDTWAIQRVTNNAVASTIASGSREFASGEKIGLRCIGQTHEIYVFAGGAWTLLGSGNDSTYLLPGRCGMRVRNTVARVDDVFAGTIPPQSISLL